MTPQKARMMRDAARDGQTHSTSLSDEYKLRRTLRFDPAYPNDPACSVAALSGIEKLAAEQGPTPNSISVCYDVCDHSLAQIESFLTQAGLHLDNRLAARIIRALSKFCEETQARNMQAPTRLIKAPLDAYAKAWDSRVHGDRDPAPPEMRHER